MQAAEAVQRLIDMADRVIEDYSKVFTPELYDEGGPEVDELDRKKLAVAVSQAMLNSMIPVARFRAFVEVDELQPKRKPSEKYLEIRKEFTVCATDIAGVTGGLVGLSVLATNVRILLFEQRATGADVVTAFQGRTKSGQYRSWLKELDHLEANPTVN